MEQSRVAPDSLSAQTVLGAFVLSRLLLILLTCCMALVRQRSPLQFWNQWDGQWFVAIALHGYHWGMSGKSPLAFFPLYPLFIHVGTMAGISAVLAAIVVSNVAFLGALLYFYRLASEVWGPLAAGRAVWILAFFPTAFFTFAPYSEALFLLCALGALHHARKGDALVAGLWVAAAVLTRPTGIVLLPAVLFALHPNRLRTWLLGLVPTLLSLAVYLAFLAANNLPVSGLLSAQRGWHRALTFPWTGFWASIRWFLDHGGRPAGWAAEDLLQLAITLAFLALTVAAWQKMDRPIALYCAGFWLLVLTSPEWLPGPYNYVPFNSMDRFVLALFPLAGWAATMVSERRLRSLLIASASAMVGSAWLYTIGAWVG